MTQFFLYRNANKATQEYYPYLLDIQSNLLEDLRTTVVIPLMPKRLAGDQIMSRLNPVLAIGNADFTLVTQNLAGIDRALLGENVSDLGQHRAEVIAAIDFVLSGI